MDPNYYVTTLIAAAQKLGPLVLYLVGGFILFVKVPFWFFSKVVKENRPAFLDELAQHPRLKEYNQLIGKMNAQSEQQQQARPKVETKAEAKAKPQAGAKSENKSKPGPKPGPKVEARTPKASAEELVFDLLPGQRPTKAELKKKYHQLLLIHHPDKVAGLAPELRHLAELKTKEINWAYNRLKQRAA